MARLTVLTLALVAATILARADADVLSSRPVQGWNSWNRFGCDISEDTILDAARAVVSSGLSKFGYEYVMMDDCWHADSRDPDTGAPRAHPQRFSKGIKYIADEVHALGLKLGIYSSAGTKTCVGKFGSLGYEEIDARTYAEWDADYLKYDNCYSGDQYGTPQISFERYEVMSKAMRATGRPMIYAICNWGQDRPWEWGARIAQSWRISGDIWDSFDHDGECRCESMLDCPWPGKFCSVSKIIEYAVPLSEYAGPGHWNDLDMLEVGNGGMRYDESITHFSMWVLLKSPLILGHDLTKMSDETFEIVTNGALIAIHQDTLGRPARRIWKRAVEYSGSVQLWAAPLASGETVIAVVNLSPLNLTVPILLGDALELTTDRSLTYAYFDLWQRDDANSWGKKMGTWSTLESRDINVKTHATRVFRLTPV